MLELGREFGLAREAWVKDQDVVILFDPGLRHSAVSRFEAMIEDRDNRGAVIEDRGAMIEDRSRIAVAVQ